MGHVRTQLNTYVYMYLDSIEGTEYIADLFLVYMIYVTMGRFGIEILCLSMSNFNQWAQFKGFCAQLHYEPLSSCTSLNVHISLPLHIYGPNLKFQLLSINFKSPYLLCHRLG